MLFPLVFPHAPVTASIKKTLIACGGASILYIIPKGSTDALYYNVGKLKCCIYYRRDELYSEMSLSL
jgi:hypothetical protein